MNIKNLLLKKKSKIAVWGVGYIGLSSMVYFAKKGVICKGYDIDIDKVNKINKGHLPIPELKDWFNINIKNLVNKKNLSATNKIEEVLENEFKGQVANLHYE